MGKQLSNDLELGTTLLCCAVCSELKNVSQFTSLILKDADIPENMNYDEAGILNSNPIANEENTQVRVCKGCFCNGKVFVKHFNWNVNGLGKFTNDLWLSEESFVSTLACSIRVKHSGGGGHSFKQESQGNASFCHQNPLLNIHQILSLFPEEESVDVCWVRKGKYNLLFK
jgi:hypothetical protein